MRSKLLKNWNDPLKEVGYEGYTNGHAVVLSTLIGNGNIGILGDQ